jgi:outer membrane immunogenic protein
MKSYLSLALASVLSVSGLTAASAADLPMKAPPPAPVMVSNFTGCYIDGGATYNVWNNDHSLTGPFGPGGALATTVSTTDGGRGWGGRVGGGCDYQFSMGGGNWVVGILGDYDFMDAPGNYSPSELFPPAGAGSSPLTFRIKQTDAYYVGARIGYVALPNLLTYVDGGWTGTRFSSSPEQQTATGAFIGFSYPSFTSNNGWFVGGGTEYLLPWFKGLYWRNEYRYAEYGFRDIAEFSTVTGALDGNVQHVRTVDQTVTTSLVWKFNWTQPVVAKY